MLKFMLDTNICIFTIKNKPVHVRERFNLNSGRMCISSVTLMELIYGAEKSQMPERNLAVIEGFVSRLEVLDYDMNFLFAYRESYPSHCAHQMFVDNSTTLLYKFVYHLNY